MVYSNLSGTTSSEFELGNGTDISKRFIIDSGKLKILNNDGTLYQEILVGDPTDPNSAVTLGYARKHFSLLTSSTAQDKISIDPATGELNVNNISAEKIIGSVSSAKKIDGKTVDDTKPAAADVLWSSSKVQSELDTKQGPITGAVSNMLSKNVEKNKVIISDAAGKLDVSTITAEELGYLSGLTGNVQEQLANINDYIYLDAADITLTDTESENKEVLVQKAKVALEAKYPSAAAKSAAVVNATFTPSDRVEAHMFKYTGTEWVYQFQLTTGIKPADHDVAGTVESSEDIAFVSGKGTVVQAGKVKRRLRIKNGATSKYFDGSEDVEFTYSDIGAASAAQGALADTAIQTATVIHTETLPSGSSATAEIVKTGTEIGFNFGIPRGAAGAKLFPVGAWTANTDYVCNDTKIDIVNYDGNGYACNQSHTSSNTFDPTKWTILVHQGEPGPKGDPGSKGDPGDIGTAAGFATPEINVATGAAGSVAQATIDASGPSTQKKFTFGFTIPRGDPGAPGDPGRDGTAATIQVGSVTTGDPGTNAAVSNGGTETEASLNFVIPRGDRGLPGDAATIRLGTVTTGAAGSDVIITNTGTATNAEFNFTIPRGDKGEGQIITKNTLAEFPNVGSIQNLYVSLEQKGIIYRWDETDAIYKILAENLDNIIEVNGGGA